MVITILLGAYWKRFTSSAAFWTLFGGSMIVALSIAWPILISPFSHGVDPSGGFKYTRALYGLVGSLLIGVIVSFLTRAKSKEKMKGLLAGTLNQAKEFFKGGPINETEGNKAVVRIVADERVEGVHVSPELLRLMSAHEGDLVHLSDDRRWLGGLRSTQTKISSVHDRGSDVVIVSPVVIKKGNLIRERRHRLEKIL
jgi:hypothetical protein